MQHLLQQNAFPIIIFIAESGADALKDKLCGAVQGDRKTVALYQWSGNHTGKCIACAGIVCGQVGTRYFPLAVSLSVIGVNASFARISLYGHAGDNNDTRAVPRNFMQVSF